MRLGRHDCYLVTPDQSLGCHKRFFAAPESGVYVWLPITVFDAMFVACIIFSINLLCMQVSNLIPQYYESCSLIPSLQRNLHLIYKFFVDFLSLTSFLCFQQLDMNKMMV